jgi:hypothetical protein
MMVDITGAKRTATAPNSTQSGEDQRDDDEEPEEGEIEENGQSERPTVALCLSILDYLGWFSPKMVFLGLRLLCWAKREARKGEEI